jgi:hypothetical protein
MKLRIILLWGLLVLAACGATGAESTQSFTYDYPDPANVEFSVHTGTLNIQRGAASGVQGQVTTNVSDWRVQQSLDVDGTLQIIQGRTRNQLIPNASSRWDVELAAGPPLNLTINSESAGGSLELGGLPTAGVRVEGVSGDYEVVYDTPNLLDDGGVLQVRLTTGKFTMNGLFNSHVRSFRTVSTGGNQTFEFAPGTLVQNLNGDIETTTGNVVLRIPVGTPVRVTFTAASGRVLEATPEFVLVNPGVYETAEYADADQPRVRIAVRTVAGDLRLVGVPPL